MKMFAEFQQVAKEIFDSAAKENRLVRNPDNEQLRTFAQNEPEVLAAKYMNLAVVSEPMSRAAAMTKNNSDTDFGEAERKLLELAKMSLARQELVSIDVSVGDGSEGITARLILPKKYSRLADQWEKWGKPTVTVNPTYTVMMFFDEEYENNKSKVPGQKAVSIRCAQSADGKMVKIVRIQNSKNFGMQKKGFSSGEDTKNEGFSSPQNKVKNPLGTSKYLEWKNSEPEFQAIRRGRQNGASSTCEFQGAVKKIDPLVRETAEIFFGSRGIPDAQNKAGEARQYWWEAMLGGGFERCDDNRPVAPFGRGTLNGICLGIAFPRIDRRQTTLGFDPIDDRPNPMQMAMRDEWRNKVSRGIREAFSVLPAEQKEALILVFWHGANLAAVARERGISVGTLYARVFRALATLRVLLENFNSEF